MPICGCRSDVAESPTKRPPEDNTSAQRRAQDTSAQRTSATAQAALSRARSPDHPLLPSANRGIGVDLRDLGLDSGDVPYQRRRRLPIQLQGSDRPPSHLTPPVEEDVEQFFNRGTSSRRLAPNFTSDLPRSLNRPPQADAADQGVPNLNFLILQDEAAAIEERERERERERGGEEMSREPNARPTRDEQTSSLNSSRADGEEEDAPAAIPDIY